MHTFTSLSHLKIYLLFVVILSGCSPDPDVAEQQSNNAQNQLKTITVNVTTEVPIAEVPSNLYGGSQLYVICGATSSTISSNVPSNIGQEGFSLSFTAAPSSNVPLSIYYYNTLQDLNVSPPNIITSCSTISVEVLADGELFYSVDKILGGSSCFDGTYFGTNLIVPN